MAKMQRSQPNRKSIRYKNYDYTRSGAYFITICAHRGHSIFGMIQDDQYITNALGQIAEQCWLAVPAHHQMVRLDTHVIMPNHVHLLFWISADSKDHPDNTDREERIDLVTARGDGGQRLFGKPIAGSVSTIIGTYKAAVTRIAKSKGLVPGSPLWHGRFWDRIVRDDLELARIREYIRLNPQRWIEDQLHPQAPPNRFNHWDE